METALLFSSIAMIAMAILILALSLYRAAPYGRYAVKKRASANVDARAAWLILQSPNLLVPTLVLSTHPRNYLQNGTNALLLFIFLAHAAYRAVLYPVFRMRRGSSSAMPLWIVLFAFALSAWNALQQAIALLLVHEYQPMWPLSPRVCAGLLLALMGFVLNAAADASLMRIRLRGRYDVPRGPLFSLVSCPNYLGEIVYWLGWAIACWSFAAFAFTLLISCILLPRALSYHKGYKRRFQNYPPSRKAIIPFLL